MNAAVAAESATRLALRRTYLSARQCGQRGQYMPERYTARTVRFQFVRQRPTCALDLLHTRSVVSFHLRTSRGRGV
jgi:hypothetical protein